MIYKIDNLDKLKENHENILVIYGGSFSPPHIYHEQIIINLLKVLPRAKVIIVPVNDLYPKKDLIVGYNEHGINHRITLCDIMVADIQHKFDDKDIDISISDIAFHYNIPKVDRFVAVYLNETYPNHRCVFYFGQDVYDNFDTWDKEDKEVIINDKYDIIIHPRNNNISSSNIKKMKKEHNTLQDLIDPIEDYIHKYKLL